MHFSPRVQTAARQNPLQARSHLQPSGIGFFSRALISYRFYYWFFNILFQHFLVRVSNGWSMSVKTGSPTSTTLSWHLASETKSTLKGTSQTVMRLIYKTLAWHLIKDKALLFCLCIYSVCQQWVFEMQNHLTYPYHAVLKTQKILGNLLQFSNYWVCIRSTVLRDFNLFCTWWINWIWKLWHSLIGSYAIR